MCDCFKLENVERKGRLNYVCQSCGKDVTLAVFYVSLADGDPRKERVSL